MADPATQSAPAARETLPATLRLGAAHLVVTDLDRSIAFYERSIGLRLHARNGAVAALGGGGEDLLVLHEEPDARRAGRHAGLYHVALLHPSRVELARAALRLAETRTPIRGASDHGISEAIYLLDSDGNELELAADRPKPEWPDLSRELGLGPRPLDAGGLLATVAGEEPRPHVDPGLVVGHVHLHVGAIEEAVRFYCDTLGFEVTARIPSAVFASVGGYHHHVAFNTWRGEGVPPAPTGTVGLRHWTIVLDHEDEVERARARASAAGYPVEEREDGLLVRDPWDIAVLLTTEPERSSASPG